LLGEKRGSFSVKGSNWLAAPKSASESAWRELRQLLETEHRKLIAAVTDPRNTALVRKHTKMILGVAFHDIYNTGQICLLHRMQNRG